MNPALKLDCMFAHFPYGGNGGVSSEIPQIRRWEVETALKMLADKRVGWFESKDFSDTPICMTRNRAIRTAKAMGAHLLLMIDSDNDPLKHAGEPWFKPFWDEAFNFIYKNYQAGPRLVFAPYCGPPNNIENVYVFKAQALHNHAQETAWKLEAYNRDEASMMTGIQEAAAGPTGMILIDMRLFDLIEPVAMSKEQIVQALASGMMTPEQGLHALREGYCYYEWEDQYADQKASTEDVTLTRDIALAGMAKLGYNPVFCAWDSWIGHHKPWNVGKPQRYTLEAVNASYRKAVLDNARAEERIVDMSNFNQGDDPLSRRLRAMAAGVDAALPPISPPDAPPPDNGHKKNGNVASHVVEHNGKQCRATDGEWYMHGGAPPEQLAALQDMVRAHAYRINRNLRILEVGTWLGGTAIAMAEALTDSQVHCVDTWAGSPSDCTGECAAVAGGADAVYAEFEKRVGSRLDKSIIPWRKCSAEAAALYWEQFDVVFIDAEHTYEAAKANILEWWQHLRDDGIMLGHDYNTRNCMGVTKAVHELFGNKFETFGWDAGGGMWKVRKSDFPDGLLGMEVACAAEKVD